MMYKEDRFARHKNRLKTYGWTCGSIGMAFVVTFLITKRFRYLALCAVPFLIAYLIYLKIDKDEKLQQEGEWKPKKRIKKQQHENNPNK